MKKLAVLALALLLIPSAFAIVSQTHEALLQTTFITQGYEFARIQGFNQNDMPVSVLRWHMYAELGASHAFCELQPAALPAGPFDVDIVVHCQTRSGFTTLFPTGTRVNIETFAPDGTPENSFKIEKAWIETRPQVPTPFPITPVGQAIMDEQASSAGTFMFFAGIGAIVILTAAVILLSRQQQEE